ncbi:MAG: discoidin domain-containing protein [Clostridia bacterium]
MKDITIRSFRDLKIEDKNVLDCITNPIAYAACSFDPVNYNKYFLLSYYFDTWGEIDMPFIESQNEILSHLKLEMKDENCNTKDQFVKMVQTHIDQDEPVFVFFDYYHIFYNTSFYKRKHISHGIIITGYNETNNTFGLRERIIIQPDGLYYLQLTEDMVYDMWEASCISMQWDRKIYYMKENQNCVNLETEEIIQNVYQYTGQNNLINYIQSYDRDFSETIGFFLRRQYDATVYFFELIRQILLSNELEAEIGEFGEKYTEFLDLFINKALKIMMTGAICQNKMEKQANELLTLDQHLFSLLGKISKEHQALKNVALGCKVTASSMVAADIPYSGDKTVNGKYGAADMMQNHWVSNSTDKVHWITYDLGQKWPIKKIVLYHIKCNVLISYIIQGSNDNQHWDDLCKAVNNQEGITPYYLKGQSYQFLRLFITNPSTQGNAARLLEFQAWA